MISKHERKAIIDLIRSQVVPAIGCTEPIAVALCVAKARATLGAVPESVTLHLSANILKNAMGVGIPGTGMIGLPIAVALGALIGRADLGLEVLHDCNKKAVAQGRKFIDEGRINIQLETTDKDKLFINAVVSADGHDAEATIRGGHTNFVFLRRDADVLLDRKGCEAAAIENGGVELTLRKVYDFAMQTDVDDLRFILDARQLNEAAANEGLRENYGHELGKTLCSPLGKGIMGDSIFSHILARTSCACDARMAGAMIPVMSNSGSGNQGICTTMPVVVYAEENHNTEEELVRALILSNLTAIYIKQNLGPLSALCGCVVAATGSSCGITYLMGGGYNEVSFAVQNMIANVTGMICDGAKPSCALKMTTGVGTGVMSAMLAIEHRNVTSVEGIIDDDVDQSIRNLASIGTRGMDTTDKFILDIMTHKTHRKK